MITADIRAVLIALIPPEQLDTYGTWIHWCELMQTYGHCSASRIQLDLHRPRRYERQIAQKASDLLKHINPGCKGFRNAGYCPETPYGQYHWHFAVQMIQNVLWNTAEFQRGFRFGRKPSERYRDANPFKFCPARSQSWDCGYILGLAKPNELRNWARGFRKAVIA